MVRERTKHLPHSEPSAAGTAETRFAVLDGDSERGAGVNKAAIVCVFTQTGQHADPGIRDNDFKGARYRRKGHQSGLRPAAMPEDILLQFAHGADDGRGKRFAEPDCDRRLFGAASPKRPLIGSIAGLGEASQRERTVMRGVTAARDGAVVERCFDDGREGRSEADLGKSDRVFAARHQHLNQWAETTRAVYADRAQARQAAGLGRPQEVIGAGKVAVQLVIRTRRCGQPTDPRPMTWQGSGWTMNWPALSRPPPDPSSLADLLKTCRIEYVQAPLPTSAVDSRHFRLLYWD